MPENKIIRNKTAQPFYHGWAVFASTMLLEHLVLTIAFTKDPKLCIYWLVPEALPPVLLPEPPDSDPPVEPPRVVAACSAVVITGIACIGFIFFSRAVRDG